MSNKIVSEVVSIFGVKENEVQVISRIMGGYSNELYLIEVMGQRFTIRFPGDYADYFVNREEEAYHLGLINPIGVNSRVAYNDVETGIKISEYIEGTTLASLNYLEYLSEVSDVLHKVHRLTSKYDYNPLEHLSLFESYLKDYIYPEAYLELKLFMIERLGRLSFQTVMCHGDCQPANFVLGDKLYLLDWEFSGNNDPFYDIACFGDENWSDAEKLLPVYLGEQPSVDEWERLYLWGIFQSLQWYNVAVFKHEKGMSETLNIDFYGISVYFIEKATSIKNKFTTE